MSSIASPTTTTRHCAIFASSASMRSRDRRESFGLISGEGRVVVEAVGEADRADELRARGAHDMARVAREVHAPVADDAESAELPARPQPDAHRSLHDALEEHGGSGVLR